MKFKFEGDLDYQLEAIDSTVNLFIGEKSANNNNNYLVAENGIIPNKLSIPEKVVFSNLKRIQDKNKIKKESINSMDFSIEMETGTGKTYVYLRTILELNKKYGMKKFIILVPSIAIKEGVIKTLQITREHFSKIYDKPIYNYYEHNSKKLSLIRQFSRNNNIEILIMTLDSINKDTNILRGEAVDSLGDKPLNLIQKTNPILILDEPQNMESSKSREALNLLNPLFSLRYSATHKEYYNLLYSLNPVEAYNRGLVKKIDVLSVVKENDYSGLQISCKEISSSGNKLKVKLNLQKKNAYSKYIQSDMVFDTENNGDLFKKTNNPKYHGIKVSSINKLKGFIELSNGVKLELGANLDVDREEIMKNQIRETIALHLEKSKELKLKNIKVLSLFFIDRVPNYLPKNGFIRKTFEEEFDKLKLEYDDFKNLDSKKVHEGYFAMKNETEAIERESAISKNKEAFDLIMRNKEKLLSFEEDVQFIFSHSALKEGWDNPNIFNICTLNETKSEMKKRQELGRGIRLPVNQDGTRLTNEEFRLTVVANESYLEYASNLQKDYEEDGIMNMIKVDNRNERTTVKTKKGFELNENFKELWKRISQKTEFLVKIDTKKLIEDSVHAIQEIEISDPIIRIERASLTKSESGVDYLLEESKRKNLESTKNIPNIIEEIKLDTQLTSKTILEILNKIKNFDFFLKNPEDFLQKIKEVVNRKLRRILIDEILYNKKNDFWTIDNFQNIETYESKLVRNVKSTVYDSVICDGQGEKDFAKDMERDKRVLFYIKLPSWFIVGTPVGRYNPDWAISFDKNPDKLYFVSETKIVKDLELDLRNSEGQKIECAKKHFETIGTEYYVVKSYGDLTEKLKV